MSCIAHTKLSGIVHYRLLVTRVLVHLARGIYSALYPAYQVETALTSMANTSWCPAYHDGRAVPGSLGSSVHNPGRHPCVSITSARAGEVESNAAVDVAPPKENTDMPPKPTKVLPKYLDKATEDVTTLDLLRAFRDGGFLRDFPHLALTMFAVILRANRDENYSCRPAYALLAQDTGLAEQVVRRHCRALEKDGLLTRTFRPRTTNVFTVEVHFILQVARGVMQDRATGNCCEGGIKMSIALLVASATKIG